MPLEVPGSQVTRNGIRMKYNQWAVLDEEETDDDVLALLDEPIWQVN